MTSSTTSATYALHIQHSNDTDYVHLHYSTLSTLSLKAPTPFSFMQLKTLCSLQIFPYRRWNLPNSNAPCAQFRLWRKELTAREKQVELLKALEKETYWQAETLQKTVELQHIVFGLRAQVHQISASFAQAKNEEYQPESPLLLVSKPTATSSSNPPPIDVYVHPRYIPSKTTCLEIVSCPSSPLSFPSPSVSSAPSPISPLFQPYTPNIVPCSPSADDTATLHLANIMETLNLFSMTATAIER